jgi:precorrin-6A/cobalt-precorrin-6A reductase
MRVLILGGTTEARGLAEALHARGVHVTTSLAGRTEPQVEGDVRIGGFGGAAGLRRWVEANGIDVVIDATHPFATQISQAAQKVGAIRLERPGWELCPNDRLVNDMAQAAAVCTGRRVFLTTGHHEIHHFTDGWYLVRAITRPRVLPPHHELLLDRGPFTLEGERALLERHAIEVLVTKDSGGPAPKLQAARERGCEVVVVRRPRATGAAATVAEVLDRVMQHAARRPSPGGRKGRRPS